MKYYIKNILFVAAFTIVLFSCKKKFLDVSPDEFLTIDSVFSNAKTAEMFLSAAYFTVPEEYSWIDWWARNPFTMASDEGAFPWGGSMAEAITSGNWNAGTVEENIYRFYWEGIRKTNLFLENIGKTDFSNRDLGGKTGEQQKNEFIGEAHFLKAYFHYLEMRAHGPVQILDRALTSTEDYSKIKRATYDECVEFVVKECDKAAGLLPATRPRAEAGRATKIAALALKARLLLYAASPLFNGNSEYSNFRTEEGKHFINQTYDAAKWQKAADAAKACIDQAEAAGVGLYQPTNDPYMNYYRLFIDLWNPEVIFARNLGKAEILEFQQGAKGQGGWGGMGVSQELVDAFEMNNGIAPIIGYNSDGTPIINPASGYVETGYTPTAGKYYPAGVRNMYINRDPRFYVTVNFNGQQWRGRQLEFWNTGRDGKAIGNAQDYPITGYMVRKFADEEINLVQRNFKNKHWILFRFAEQYLNYAEALNEAQGPVSDVYNYINKVRSRAGMPNLPAGLSKEEMRERIRHERRVELAFETHRYFDCRRWKISPQIDNKMFYRMSYERGTSLQDNAFYQRVQLKRHVFDAPKHYLFPIPQGEIDKAPWIIQNPGW